jgi:hypothetical protein
MKVNIRAHKYQYGGQYTCNQATDHALSETFTLPELWSGIVKENILFAPGAHSSTVMVVIICRKENSGYSISSAN